jgi:hypothetical protein
VILREIGAHAAPVPAYASLTAALAVAGTAPAIAGNGIPEVAEGLNRLPPQG